LIREQSKPTCLRELSNVGYSTGWRRRLREQFKPGIDQPLHNDLGRLDGVKDLRRQVEIGLKGKPKS